MTFNKILTGFDFCSKTPNWKEILWAFIYEMVKRRWGSKGLLFFSVMIAIGGLTIYVFPLVLNTYQSFNSSIPKIVDGVPFRPNTPNPVEFKGDERSKILILFPRNGSTVYQNQRQPLKVRGEVDGLYAQKRLNDLTVEVSLLHKNSGKRLSEKGALSPNMSWQILIKDVSRLPIGELIITAKLRSAEGECLASQSYNIIIDRGGEK
jgi:hypothetical protein